MKASKSTLQTILYQIVGCRRIPAQSARETPQLGYFRDYGLSSIHYRYILAGFWNSGKDGAQNTPGWSFHGYIKETPR